MSATKKNLTLNGFTIPHTVFVVLSVAMAIVSIYLTKHFYQVHFPTGIGGGEGLCAGDGFWGCNKATLSSLGHILFVPTSFFGIIIGLLGVFGAIFSSERMESTNKFFIYLNALGCLGLLFYSLIALGGLCPFCTAYYALSFIAAFMFFKFSDHKAFPDLKITAVYGLIVILPAAYMSYYFGKEKSKQASLSSQYVKQFEGLKDMGEPTYISPYKINMATEEWSEAPVRIAVFSDFQCPFCQKVAEQIPQLIRGLKDKVNVAYYFYPLDNACNPAITRSFHQYACQAAFLAACDKEKFGEVHDAIFERQPELSAENLCALGKKNSASVAALKTKRRKRRSLERLTQGEAFQLKSTPTIIINGKKIEGSIPTVHLRAIVESLLNK